MLQRGNALGAKVCTKAAPANPLGSVGTPPSPAPARDSLHSCACGRRVPAAPPERARHADARNPAPIPPLRPRLPAVRPPAKSARSNWYNVGFARAAAACCLIIAFVAVYRCEKYRHAMGLTKSERAQRARREREQREATVSRLAWTRASSVIPRPPLRATLASLLGVTA